MQRGFLELIYVYPAHRRQRIGSALLAAIEQRCTTPTLFTSTNDTNTAMESFLESRGYAPSGRIENLDENDPELIFVKRLA